MPLYVDFMELNRVSASIKVLFHLVSDVLKNKVTYFYVIILDLKMQDHFRKHAQKNLILLFVVSKQLNSTFHGLPGFAKCSSLDKLGWKILN